MITLDGARLKCFFSQKAEPVIKEPKFKVRYGPRKDISCLAHKPFKPNNKASPCFTSNILWFQSNRIDFYYSVTVSSELFLFVFLDLPI